jgi:hypothetical protein
MIGGIAPTIRSANPHISLKLSVAAKAKSDHNPVLVTSYKHSRHSFFPPKPSEILAAQSSRVHVTNNYLFGRIVHTVKCCFLRTHGSLRNDVRFESHRPLACLQKLSVIHGILTGGQWITCWWYETCELLTPRRRCQPSACEPWVIKYQYSQYLGGPEFQKKTRRPIHIALHWV